MAASGFSCRANPRTVMTKTKKTKTKAPAQAKVPTEIAQPAVVAKTTTVKPVAAKPVEATKPVVAAAPAQPKVRLELSKPGAQSVAIAGSFNSWQPEQAKTTGNGGWVKELTIAPGRYEYMFVVDGQWMADPNAKEFAPNPFGGQNSVLVITK
jgi:1,4-alpha-glucan branching enzyme